MDETTKFSDFPKNEEDIDRGHIQLLVDSGKDVEDFLRQGGYSEKLIKTIVSDLGSYRKPLPVEDQIDIVEL